LTLNGVSILQEAEKTYFFVGIEFSIKQQHVYRALVKQLADECADFKDQVRERFERLLVFLISFISNRTGVPNVLKPYLGPVNGANRPHESDLQEDLYSHLVAANFVDVEKWGMAAGRADLVVPGDGFNLIVENKKTSDTWDEAVGGFLGQSVAYQQADVKLGVLAILDLTDREAGYPSFERCFEVRHQVRQNEPTRTIVVVRVPGNRKAPSAMSK
jgi:hypothetical protein